MLRAILQHQADLLLVIGPAVGDPDDAAVAAAAWTAAGQAGVPIVARTRPGARGAWMIDLGSRAAPRVSVTPRMLAVYTFP